MSLAQKLYEEGYITYHRTDSVTISSSAMTATINYIKKEYGEKYVPAEPRRYFVKQKLAQEAHEAIRPTKASVLGAEVSRSLGAAFGRLYDLIWRRAVASQMSDSIIESTTVFVNADGSPSSGATPNYKLKANGSVLVFDGFLKANPLGISDNKLPRFVKDENLNLVDVLSKEHETLPPPRYNDASIIKTLEEKGIGRPSTYATIISTIENRSYIERLEGKFAPTAIGIAVNDFLVTNFSDIDDIPFTAEMEDGLDQIASGAKQWAVVMRDFYTPFEKKLAEVEGAERVKIAVEETDEMCPQCGKGNLVIRTGKFGKFLACAKFPDCKFTKPYVEETGFKCPKCGGLPSDLSAEAFAKVEALRIDGGPAAPKPLAKGGQIVVKKTRKGRKFYGCSNYPACTFAAWKLEEIKNQNPILQHVEPQRNPALREKLGDVKDKGQIHN
jgi:DNA topoisomerase-1